MCFLGHTAGEGFPLHAAGLQLFAHPAQLQALNPSPAEAASPRREGMGEPCTLKAQPEGYWDLSPHQPFLLKPRTRTPLSMSKGPCWLPRFISTCNLHLVSSIIPQEEQDFWFVIKTLWMVCQTDAYQPLGTDFDHRFWIYCWLIFKVIIKDTLFPRSLHAFVALWELVMFSLYPCDLSFVI